ncbi:MAG: NADH-quinone oxidoreductase subunit M, partial [Opitutales bacterium]|nr:NADH-quinone oxidoreductase subunit M [Opitutales bacterium]
VAALFIFADILERRFGTSEMGSLGGVYKKMPVCAGLFAAAVLANIGLPGFANFWGEFSVFAALWQFSPIVCALAVSGIVISAVYGLRAVANIFMGGEGEAVRGREAKDVGVLERLPIVLLLAGLVVFGFAPKIMTNSLNSSFVEEVVEK